MQSIVNAICFGVVLVTGCEAPPLEDGSADRNTVALSKVRIDTFVDGRRQWTIATATATYDLRRGVFEMTGPVRISRASDADQR